MPEASPKGEVILGLDPGLGTTGFGVVERRGPSRVRFLGTGVIRTPTKTPDSQRLVILYRDVRELLERYSPDMVAIERLFFSKNITTGIQVAQARGILLLACGERSMEIGEYSPMQIKSTVGGYGKASKREMQEMVKRLLRLPDIPRPDDAADALAVALCHSFQAGLSRKLAARP
jgi:crossover junction endodeoxyribonuclease RuvC